MGFQERFDLLIKILLPILLLGAINAYPKSRAVEESYRSAQIAQTNGQHQAAANSLRAILIHEPWRIDFLEQIGREAWLAGSTDEAAAALQAAASADVLSAEGSFLLAEVYQQQGNWQQAEVLWRELLSQVSVEAALRARIFEQLIDLRHQQRDFAAAADLLRDWQSLEPENARVNFLLGLHLSILDPSQALPFLLEASRLDPLYIPAVQMLRRGLNQASVEADEGYGWLVIGRSLASANYWDLAQAAFEKAVAAAPDYAEAWAFLGEARYQQGGSSKADLERAVQLAPQSITVRAMQALYWRRQGAPAQALALLQAVAQEEPLEPIWQVEIANVYIEAGDLPAAQQHFQKAIAIAPQVSLYWQYLAQFSVQNSYQIGDIGLPAARQAVLLSPNDPAALDLMGWALVTQSDFATGERFLQRALESNPSFALAHLHLAQLYIQQQDYARAYDYLKQAQQLATDDQIRLIANRLLQRYYQEGG